MKSYLIMMALRLLEPISQGMRQEAADMGTFSHNNKTYPRLQFWQIDDDYFENPDHLSEIIGLPREWLIPIQSPLNSAAMSSVTFTPC